MHQKKRLAAGLRPPYLSAVKKGRERKGGTRAPECTILIVKSYFFLGRRHCPRPIPIGEGIGE